MPASDAAPLPRLGEVFFDVRGSSRSMRLSWYADTGVAVFSIWQGGMCTGTFRLPIADLPRMVATLSSGPGAKAVGRAQDLLDKDYHGAAPAAGYEGGGPATGYYGGPDADYQRALPDADYQRSQLDADYQRSELDADYQRADRSASYPAGRAHSGYQDRPAVPYPDGPGYPDALGYPDGPDYRPGHGDRDEDAYPDAPYQHSWGYPDGAADQDREDQDGPTYPDGPSYPDGPAYPAYPDDRAYQDRLGYASGGAYHDASGYPDGADHPVPGGLPGRQDGADTDSYSGPAGYPNDGTGRYAEDLRHSGRPDRPGTDSYPDAAISADFPSVPSGRGRRHARGRRPADSGAEARNNHPGDDEPYPGAPLDESFPYGLPPGNAAAPRERGDARSPLS
jgi:hypothetical protein